MKKIPCLFVREFHDRGRFTLTRETTPGCGWALTDAGLPTVKWDGTACMVRGGVLFKRYDAKRHPKTQEYKLPPTGAIPCSDPDPVTGHWPHWIEIGQGPEDRWFREAWEWTRPTADGTYEFCGPPINGNPQRLTRLWFYPHGREPVSIGEPVSFDSIRATLELQEIEGIVFHHRSGDGRMCKIRRHDFGIPWPVAKP